MRSSASGGLFAAAAAAVAEVGVMLMCQVSRACFVCDGCREGGGEVQRFKEEQGIVQGGERGRWSLRDGLRLCLRLGLGLHHEAVCQERGDTQA